MTKGRILLASLMLALSGCTINNPQTEIVDTAVHHVGADTMPVWRVPEPEAKELSYTFELSRPGKQEFCLLFAWFGSENAKLFINGEPYYVDGEDIRAIADSLREPFINCWSELCGWNTTEISTLRYLIEEEGFFPVVLRISDATLKAGDNVLTFTTKTEDDFPIGDYMFSYVLLSNEEAVQNLPRHYWR